MESSIRKGDADQLLEYYNRSNPDEKIKTVVEATSTVSYGIQMVDPNLYTRELDDLYSYRKPPGNRHYAFYFL